MFQSLSLFLLLFGLKEEKDCDICGVEIADGASAVNEHPFKRNTAFLLGNEVIKIVDFYKT